MSEFLERLDAQRAVLTTINRHSWEEKLFGLSSGSIERWLDANRGRIPANADELIKEAAENLFFLANKSQEQITEEYSFASNKIQNIVSDLDEILNGRR